MESEVNSEDNSRKIKENSKLVSKIVFALDFLGGMVGGSIAYNLYNTPESAGYGFVAGAGITTILELGYVFLKKEPRR